MDSILAQARILVDWSDAQYHSGRYAINQNDLRMPSENLFAFGTGPIVNEGGSSVPTITNNYATGPNGTQHASLVLSTAINQAIYAGRPALITPHLPNGTYSMRFRAKSKPGTGSWAISYGLSTAYQVGTVQDLDWEDPANDAATTFTAEFNYTGSGDFAIKFALANAPIEIDQLQGHAGPLSTMPPFGSIPAGGRKAVAFDGSMPLRPDGTVDLTGHTSGLLVFDPAFPDRHTYSEYTVMVVCSLNAIPAAVEHLLNIHPNDGGTSTGNVILSEGAAPYAGQIDGFASTSSKPFQAANIAGQGVFIAGQSRDAATRTFYLDSIPQLIEPRPFSPIAVSRWTVGSWTTTNVSDLRGQMAPGQYAFTIIWDRALTHDEWIEACAAVRAMLVDRSVTQVIIKDAHHITGDSNATQGATDWPQLLASNGALAPQRNVILSNTSVGGEGLDAFCHDASGSESGLPYNQVTANGRWAKRDLPALRGIVENGRHAVLHMPLGTNDWDIINAIGTDAYVAWLQSVILMVLAEHPRFHVFWYSLLPQNTNNAGRENWETQRPDINGPMIAWAATIDRCHVVDCGNDPNIGSRDKQISGEGGFWQGDGIHFAAPGDVIMEGLSAAKISQWRIDLGIA